MPAEEPLAGLQTAARTRAGGEALAAEQAEALTPEPPLRELEVATRRARRAATLL
jgi:hypothetical protein